MLLAVYALGLAIPFLIAAALFAPAMGPSAASATTTSAIQFVSGLVLVSLGALLFAGEFWRSRLLEPLLRGGRPRRDRMQSVRFARGDDPARRRRSLLRGKLEALLHGHHVVTTDSVDPPDLVIVDIARVEPRRWSTWPDVPIVGFTNHTDKAGLQRAHTAGFDQVIVKSALAERVPEVVAELTAPLA